jgi:CheY-like chemotaxis protein
LLGNAVKFTETGEVMLRVSYTENAEYRFDVIDTGQGISLESQEAIFEPFQQAKAGFDKGGTGLGLAITKRQLELMGGHIHLSSQIGKGSCFSVLIPLELGEGVDEVFSYNQTVQISHLANGYLVNALVVDDIKENRDILARMLTEIGITVREAVDGQDCLNKLRQEAFNIVFMDIRMPVMDGMECMSQIVKQFPEKRPVCIAISASTLQHQSKEVINAGFDHFISKPFRFEAIYECLVKFLAVQFDYKQPLSEESTEETKNDFDLNRLSLPESLYHRLKEAAELNELTELETIVAELRVGDATQKQLADYYQEMLSNYNIDGILETLEKIGCIHG